MQDTFVQTLDGQLDQDLLVLKADEDGVFSLVKLSMLSWNLNYSVIVQSFRNTNFS